MSHQQYYETVTLGKLPVLLQTMKDCLKVTTDQEDDYIAAMLEASTLVVEKKLHGRQVRANVYHLFLDEFVDRICLRRDPVDPAVQVVVARLVSGTFTAVADPTTVYYIKPSTQFSEVLLLEDQSWPTDEDNIEHAVRVKFTTEAHVCLPIAVAAIKRHVTFMHENRGDCDPTSAEESFRASGAEGLMSIAVIKLV